MAYELIWSDRALKEYDKLLDYLLEEWGHSVTIKVNTEFGHTLSHIKKSPEHFPVFIKGKNIRRCVASHQTSIFFRVNKTEIEILSIFDNRQNPKKLDL